MFYVYTFFKRGMDCLNKLTICCKSIRRFFELLASTIIGVLLAHPMSSKYQFDLIFRRMLLLSKLFTKSWGTPDVLKRLQHYRKDYMSKGGVMELIERALPKMIITKTWTKGKTSFMEGYFKSPLMNYSPDLFPDTNVGMAHWKGLFPVDEKQRRGLVVHLAGTGDHSYFRRELGFANHLLHYGVSSILLENPFYGTRRPKNQFRSSLLNVSDLFVMGASLMAECCFLLKWVEAQGYWPLGLSGVSMGGHMASLAVTNVLTPTALVPCLSWTSGAPVYTRGALSEAISWLVLEGVLTVDYMKQLADINGCDWMDMLHDQSYLPHITSKTKRLMWILMEEFTNLANYPVPVDPRLVRAIVAEEDAYVLRDDDVPNLLDLWPGSSVHIAPGKGHVQAYFFEHSLFRRTIRNALNNVQSSTDDYKLCEMNFVRNDSSDNEKYFT